MTQTKRYSARAVLLAAGAASFVALGAGVAGAEGMETPVHEVAPTVERALVEGVAPTMNELAPEGVTPVAGDALSELQETAHDPEKSAPDLAAPLPGSPLADTVAETQSRTGLDGNPNQTVGQSAGEALEATAEDTSVALEDTARETGGSLEDTANELLPHTVESVAELRDEMVTLPELDSAQAPGLEGQRLPELSEAPSLTDVTELTGDNALALEELNVLDADGGQDLTEPMSQAVPTAPNMWDLAAGFGLETPNQLQEVVESTELTADNYVNLGEEEVLDMVGNRNWEDGEETVHQSAAPEAPGVGDLTDALVTGVSDDEGTDPVSLNGPLSEAQLPQVAEGVNTETAEDLVAGLTEGDLLDQVDTSDLVSIEGGGPEPETPEGMTEHPTFMDLPGSEALPVVS
ncbi:hypothetical protein [Nocardiopsis nanhaiensis]